MGFLARLASRSGPDMFWDEGSIETQPFGFEGPGLASCFKDAAL